MYVNSLFRLRAAATPTGLGDTASTSVQVDSASVLDLGAKLRTEQARLTNLLAQMRTDPELARAIGRDVTAQQAALGDTIAKYVGVYTAIFGQRPVGLGLAPIAIAAGVAILLAAAWAEWYEINKKNNSLELQAQAQVLAEQNRASLLDQAQQKLDEAAQKEAAGDSVGAADARGAAAALTAQAGTPGPGAPQPPGSQSFGDWIKANWITVAIIGGAIVIIPRLGK